METLLLWVPVVLCLSCSSQRTTTRGDGARPASAAGPAAGAPHAQAMVPQPCVATVTSPDSVALPGPDAVPAMLVHPGDVVCLARDERGAWSPVARAEPTARFLEVKMVVSGRDIMLAIHNSSEFRIDYRAAMLLHGHWRSTNVYPVLPRLSAFEMWGDPIEALALYGIFAKR